MGSTESTPRRVTVENDEDTIGVVKISESLLHRDNSKERLAENPSADDVKKLWQELLDQKVDLDHQQEKIDELLQDAFEQGRSVESESKGRASPLVEENMRKIIHEKDQEIAEIRKKKQMFEEEQTKKSVETEKAVMKEFTEGIEYMQKKYSDRKVSPVCPSLQRHVLHCYKENRHKSLNCSQLVHAYVECIEKARKLSSKRK